MPKLMSKATFNKIEAMLRDSGFTFTEIGNCCCVSSSTVSLIARGKHIYQASEAEQAKRLQGRCPYMPTLDEITAGCERIQAERSREGDDEVISWSPPLYTTLQLFQK